MFETFYFVGTFLPLESHVQEFDNKLKETSELRFKIPLYEYFDFKLDRKSFLKLTFVFTEQYFDRF